jgi:hypothetical protein
MTTTPTHGGRFTLAEGVAAGAVIVTGVIAAAVRRVHDAGNWPVAAALTALGVVASVLLLALGLRASGVPTNQALAAALWGTVPTNVFLLSQIAYVGFFFIPLEIVASALVLRIRAPLARWWVALVLAAMVRFATLGLVAVARPTVLATFPWR